MQTALTERTSLMNAETEVLGAEDRFFTALSKGHGEALGSVLAPECLLIDVLTGSDVRRSALGEVVRSGRLVFESIGRLGIETRLYGDVAVTTGKTYLVGDFDGQAFRVRSRYTHVYVRGRDGYRLVNAQGTPVAASAAPV